MIFVYTHSLPFPWLRYHSHSRPWKILDYSPIPIYSRKVIPIPSHFPFLLKQEEFKKTLTVVHGEEWFSLEWAHKIIHYYSTLVSHSTHQWSENDMLGWRSGQCKVKMAELFPVHVLLKAAMEIHSHSRSSIPIPILLFPLSFASYHHCHCRSHGISIVPIPMLMSTRQWCKAWTDVTTFPEYCLMSSMC